ncbi:rab-GTPase-TBC domain-containing protein [Phycomyces blakesleeanus]|uniref:Rab-GTPase-TBC domain-containing protein n=1 Tax=Phycomyces blakesleeanus TaxID=4837 RepID=A0ABR3B6B0_PHYBL
MTNKTDSQEDLTDNNPLALNESNPWQQFFADSEIRKIIRQDVDRTFPDVEYFRSEETQQRMTDILFIYCKINHDVSYRQGMHELLAPLYWIIDKDSIDLSENGDDLTSVSEPATKIMMQVLNSTYVEHDAYLLFERMMKYAKPWYEFNDDVPSRPACRRIQHEYLQAIDPPLYKHLESFGIEPQLYGIRWLRLLFGREFDINDLLKLWDAIFAQDPTLKIAEYICLAILLRVRDKLINHEYAECLTLLMRPSHLSGPASLVEQAKYLQENLSEDAALHILRQNDVRAGKEPRDSLWDGVRVVKADTNSRIAPNRLDQRRSQGANLDGFSSLTRGVMKSPHVREINKAIAGVMGTVQKNVNIIGDNMLGRRQTVPSEFPAGIDRLAATGSFHTHDSQNTSPENRRRKESDELARLQATNRQMADLMAKCIDLMEKELFSNSPEQVISKETTDETSEDVDQNNNNNNNNSTSSKASTSSSVSSKPDEVSLTMALAGLKHIRDVLSGKQIQFDPSAVSLLGKRNDQSSPDWRWDLVEHEEALEDKSQTPLVNNNTYLQTKPLPPINMTMPDIKALPPVNYIPTNPPPPKPQVVYRIEDLLSDPALQPPDFIRAMSSPLSSSSLSLSSPSASDLFNLTVDSTPKTPKKRSSFTFSRTVEATSISAHTMDPLDAKNVDKRKAYDYDMF